jgi:hypothetical protein
MTHIGSSDTEGPDVRFDGVSDFQRSLIRTDRIGSWDVSPKGDFFVTLAPRDPPRLHLVLNWFEELERRAMAPPR